MYLSILKKDLKRKKTMNIIILLFIILATAFVASGVNNAVATSTSLDNYFDMAGVPDFIVITMDKGSTENAGDVLDSIDEAEKTEAEDVLYISSQYIKFENESNLSDAVVLTSFEELQMKIYDTANEEITKVGENEILIVDKLMNDYNISVGDKVTISIGSLKKELTVKGSFKDAFFGSKNVGFDRVAVNDKCFDYFYNSDNEEVVNIKGNVYYVTTSDAKAVSDKLNMHNCGVNFTGDRVLMETCYILEMIVAGIMLVLSIFLIAVSVVVLRFTIGFTISEEYREIGVMKAIGIKDHKIRRLYITKYLALAVIGAFTGFLLSIPLSEALLISISKTMVIPKNNILYVNALCAVLIVAVILMFSYISAGKTKKYTPVDAIRSGETGKRYRKKGIIKLSKMRCNNTIFLAVNDVLSNPKRFILMIVIFALCMSMLFSLTNCATTLKSGNLITALARTECDLSVNDGDKLMSCLKENGKKEVEEKLDEMEEILKDNGIEGECFCEIQFKLTVEKGEKSYKTLTSLGVGTTADMYEYFEGTAPQYENEIAMTQKIADEIGAVIGDTVTIKQLEGDKEYVLTGLFQTMNNMGEGVRLHHKNDIDFSQAIGYFFPQIDFEEELNKSELEERKALVKDILEADEVLTSSECVESIINSSAMVTTISKFVFLITVIIIIFITLLMERSFVAKENGEIALLKAVGFSDGSVIKWHTLRFVIVGVISTALALLLMTPVSKLACDPVFAMMGASYGVKYEINALQVYLIYPAILLVTILLIAFVASLSTKKIEARACADIE